jgi:hypothetical protein
MENDIVIAFKIIHPKHKLKTIGNVSINAEK